MFGWFKGPAKTTTVLVRGHGFSWKYPVVVGREGGSSGIDVVWFIFQQRRVFLRIYGGFFLLFSGGLVFCGSGFYGYTVLWILLWIFNDNDNCNVNGNGNDNGNGGEAL